MGRHLRHRTAEGGAANAKSVFIALSRAQSIRKTCCTAPEAELTVRQARAIASMATSTPGMSAPKRTIDRAGFVSGKNSAYASFISL
jgi:hypothetical protein